MMTADVSPDPNPDEKAEKQAVEALRAATQDRILKRILGQYLAGKFSAPTGRSLLNALVKDSATFHLLLKLYDEQPDAFEDLLVSRANATWRNDPRFISAYDAGASVSAWSQSIRWRVYTLLCCATHSVHLDGDFVECGVDRGGTAACVINYIRPESFNGRKFYLFDTFEGLVAEQMSEEERNSPRVFPAERYPPVLEQVKKTFAPYDFVRIVPGTVPETLSAFAGGPIAYLHIDMNVAYPERAAFEFFWPHLVPGAPVIFDDYGFPFHGKQKEALDEAAKILGTQIMMLPTGQGLVWKGGGR